MFSQYDNKVDVCILHRFATGALAVTSDEAVNRYAWSGMMRPLVSIIRTELGSHIEE